MLRQEKQVVITSRPHSLARGAQRHDVIERAYFLALHAACFNRYFS